jgi:hypothetical protein
MKNGIVIHDTNVAKKSNNITKEIKQKFSYLDWKLIEQKISDNELNILFMLIKYMNYITNFIIDDVDMHMKYKIIGEEIYLQHIRPKLEILRLNAVIIDDKPTAKKKAKQQNKTELIKLQTLEKSIKTFIDLLFKKYTNDNISNNITNDIISLNILEYIGITLMFQLNNYIKLLKKHKSVNDCFDLYRQALGTYVSIKLFINKCTDIHGSNYLYTNQDILISKTLFDDIKCVLRRFDDLQYGTIKNISYYAPQLLIQCDHQNIIPKTNIKPRKSQSDTMKSYVDHFNNGVLIVSNAMIGTGKTTLIVPIAQHTIIQRKTKPEYKQYQLVFCCNILSVKIQAATLCFNALIPFGMAHICTKMFDKDNNETTDQSKMIYKKDVVVIINNFNCKKDDDRIVIIGSPDAIKILYENDTDYSINYTLFLDEPTVGLDSNVVSHELLSANIWLLINSPKRTILSSATMPSFKSNSMQYIINHLYNKYPGFIVNSIIGNEILIGCDVVTYTGDIIKPHNCCESVASIYNTIEHVKINPFLGRLYTYDIFYNLVKTSEKITYMYMFEDIKDINANSIKEKSLMLMDELVDDDTIKKCCMLTNNNSSLNMTSIGTHDAYMFPNMTLIAVYSEIINNTLEIFIDLIKDLSYDYFTLIMNDYDNAVKKYEEDTQDAIASRKKKVVKKSKDFDDSEKQDKNQIDMDLMAKIGEQPKIKFPLCLQINSEHHLKKYNKFGSIKPRMQLILENIDFNSSVDDKIKILLMCGVGVYSPMTLDQKYTNEVIRLATNGMLAFVIADYNISYGTNYPFNTVVITKLFVEKHSMNTLFQLMGRAGRVNRSWTANVFVPQELYDKFITYITNPSVFDTEEIKLYDLIKKMTNSRF